MTKKSLNLFFCVDAGFSLGFYTTLVTLLDNFSPEVTPIVNVLDSGLEEEFKVNLLEYIEKHPKKPVLKFKKVSEEFTGPFKDQTYYLNKNLFRPSTISKIAIPVIFPEIDFGVYVDCDIYFQKDLSELLSLEGQEAPFYAIQDRFIKTLGSKFEGIDNKLYGTDPKAPYFNGGFFVANLKGFDRQAYWEKIKEVSQKGKLSWEDQSLLNITLCNRWKPIPNCWNRMVWPQHLEYCFPKNDMNYHFFGGQKPWGFSPHFSFGLVPMFYKILKDNPMAGFKFNQPTRPHSLWWIKNSFKSLFSKNS